MTEPPWYALSRSLFEPGDDGRHECGGILTRRREELLEAVQGLCVGTVRDAPDDVPPGPFI